MIIIAGAFTLAGCGIKAIDKIATGKERSIMQDEWEFKMEKRNDAIEGMKTNFVKHLDSIKDKESYIENYRNNLTAIEKYEFDLQMEKLKKEAELVGEDIYFQNFKNSLDPVVRANWNRKLKNS